MGLASSGRLTGADTLLSEVGLPGGYGVDVMGINAAGEILGAGDIPALWTSSTAVPTILQDAGGLDVDVAYALNHSGNSTGTSWTNGTPPGSSLN